MSSGNILMNLEVFAQCMMTVIFLPEGVWVSAPNNFFPFFFFLSFPNCFAEAESATSALQCGVNPVLCRGIPVKAGKSFAPTTCSQFHKDCRGEDFKQKMTMVLRSALLVFSVSSLVAGLPQILPQASIHPWDESQVLLPRKAQVQSSSPLAFRLLAGGDS